MLSDEKSVDSPSEGFRLMIAGSIVNYWDIAGTTLDWTMNTGVNTGSAGDEVLIMFGNPARSFMIWGINFHKEQFEERNPNGINLKLAYSYYLDIENGAYNSGDYRNPTAPENGKYIMAVNPSDLDDQGCFYFTEPDGKPLVLIASVISLDLESGILNFDLIGTDVDFVGMAKGRMSNNTAYNWYSDTIERFWIKGNVLSSFNGSSNFLYLEDASGTEINTRDEKNARHQCTRRCDSSHVYYATRKSDENKFHCKCFTKESHTIIGEVFKFSSLL